jgi:hypothetical protein
MNDSHLPLFLEQIGQLIDKAAELQQKDAKEATKRAYGSSDNTYRVFLCMLNGESSPVHS